MKKAPSLTIVFLACQFVFADGTQLWQQSKFEEFEKGSAKGVAISSDGSLELAPQFKLLYTSPSTYLWAVAADKSGAVFAAAGSPARVYRITSDGTAETIFDAKELQVQALIIGNGFIYAATSPDGKVYKLEPPAAPVKTEKKPTAEESGAGWRASIFFDPKTKYIWSLALDRAENLYVATGDGGQIFRVTKTGEGSLFFQSDEAHIRALAIDSNGNLIAGSDGSGLIYRISPAGEAFVLYSAAKKEITALALDDAGNIYAAGAGEKRAAIAAPPAPVNPAIAAVAPAANPPVAAPVTASGGSEIYRIAPDGSPTVMWSSHEDLVYALAMARIAGQSQLIAGTGNKGRIIAIRDHNEFTDLLKATANQVTGFATDPSGGLFVSTSNLGKIFRLGPDLEAEGDYQSDVFDAHLFSHWGRAEVRGQGKFDLLARSGNVDNPDRNWSPWQKLDFAPAAASTNAPQVPPARFIQWKALLHSSSPQPRVESVSLNYLSKNVPPVVDDVEVQVPSANASPGKEIATGAAAPAAQPAVAATAAKEPRQIIVRWSAHDDNDDQLQYSLLYRGDGEANWKPLTRDKISDKTFSFDPSLLADGGYIIKVVASDAPSHSPEDALSAEKESDRFEVNTTPPRIQDLHAAVETEGQLHLTFRASDDFSPIRRAEYALDAGEWQFVSPVGQLSDSPTENYDFNVPLPLAPADDSAAAAPKKSKRRPRPAPPGEHVIVVRVYDRSNNVGTAKVVVK